MTDDIVFVPFFIVSTINNKTGKQWWQILYENLPHCCAQKFNIYQMC